MTALRSKTALVIGGSSGIGRATVLALLAQSVRVTAVARGAAGLAALADEAGQNLQTLRADAADPLTARRLLTELRPDLVVLAAGVRPQMLGLDEQSWESFSEAWHADAQAAFHLFKAAVTLPLSPGSAVVVVSSGAAINGSSRSGGYASAKRAQWLLAGYAQQLSDQKQLGVRCLAVLPGQLVENTAIAHAAATTYGALQGMSAAEFMKRNPVPLDVNKVAAAIVAGLRGDYAPGVTAVRVKGDGVESLG
jgi:NAD(P)-dependent dehydrogenase (short-subunit alcohol dehydrogenase family)